MFYTKDLLNEIAEQMYINKHDNAGLNLNVLSCLNFASTIYI